MKAAMDENGVITISPESPVEAFALRRFAGNLKQIPASVLAQCPVDHPEVFPAKFLIIDHAWRARAGA